MNEQTPAPSPKPLPDPRVMTPEELGVLLTRLDIVEQWIELVRACAYAAAQKGITIPGRKLVMKRGRRQWTEEMRAIVAVLHEAGLGDDKIFETTLRSPTQIEKLLKPNQRSVLGALCQMISSGTTLASDDDKRPAVPAQGFSAFPELPVTETAVLPTTNPLGD